MITLLDHIPDEMRQQCDERMSCFAASGSMGVYAYFALGIEGREAAINWRMVLDGTKRERVAMFRQAREDIGEVRDRLRAVGVTSLMCGTTDPDAEPDFIKEARFFGFTPCRIWARQEV